MLSVDLALEKGLQVTYQQHPDADLEIHSGQPVDRKRLE
jgi:hypothetical protein